MINDYIQLLSSLVSTPSISRDESNTAALLVDYLKKHGLSPRLIGNNVIAKSSKWDNSKPVLMLNSHHDTVKPNQGYTRDPYSPTIEDGKLFGLGSNDASGALVALTATFLELQAKDLPYNLLLCLSAEEECSGQNGMQRIVSEIGSDIDMAIVGEPTSMRCAIGERGLMVLDCTSHGKSGHAARNEGDNALYHALDDINKLRNLKFERTSPTLGPIGLNVTIINGGTQHNVIPAQCDFVVDVRTTDAYTNEETLAIIRKAVDAEVNARSTRLRASAIDPHHPLVKAIDRIGIEKFLSPTMSDMALMPFPSIKIGPGDSARSHTADEYIHIDEVTDAITTYRKLLETIQL